MPAAQVLAIQRGHGARDAGAGEHAPHFLARRAPRGVLRFGQPPEALRRLVQVTGHERVVDVLETVQPPHHRLVLLEHGDGARMLPVVLQGRDELAEHRRGVRRQFQRAGQRPDRQVAGPALEARVAEVVQHPRVLRAGAVPAPATAAAACARSSNPASCAAPATSRATSPSGSASPCARRCRSRPGTSPDASRPCAFSSSSATPTR